MAALIRTLARAALACSVAASACGEPVVGDAYRGAPIWSYEGDLQRSQDVPRGTRYRMALFYAPTIDALDLETFREQVASGVDVVVPSSYVLNVYEPPGPELMLAGRDFGAARQLVYDDTNHDGRREPGEPFVGINPSTAFLYLPRAMGPGEATSRGPLSAGFHAVMLPQPCGYLPPGATTTDGTCGVPLGSSCVDDAACGKAGVCLKETKFPWPAGYCVVPEPPKDGCRPSAGAYLHAPLYSLTPPGLSGFWGRACASDADCARPGAREQIFACDPTTLACMPGVSNLVPVGGRVEVEPLCAGTVRAAPPSPTP